MQGVGEAYGDVGKEVAESVPAKAGSSAAVRAAADIAIQSDPAGRGKTAEQVQAEYDADLKKSKQNAAGAKPTAEETVEKEEINAMGGVPEDPEKLQKKKMEKKRNEKRNKKRFIKAQRAEEERRVRSVTGGAKRKSQDGTDVLDPSCLALGQPGMYTDNVFSDIRAQFEFKVRDESRTRIRKAVI